MTTWLAAVRWWAWFALLFGCASVVVGIWWPERSALVLALGLAAVTLAVLSLREERE
jgi:hypothetical protein